MDWPVSASCFFSTQRLGETCCIDQPPLVTSSRRFDGRRPAAIVWGWIRIHLLYYFGASPDRLARRYQSETHRPGGAGLS